MMVIHPVLVIFQRLHLAIPCNSCTPLSSRVGTFQLLGDSLAFWGWMDFFTSRTGYQLGGQAWWFKIYRSLRIQIHPRNPGWDPEAILWPGDGIFRPLISINPTRSGEMVWILRGHSKQHFRPLKSRMVGRRVFPIGKVYFDGVPPVDGLDEELGLFGFLAFNPPGERVQTKKQGTTFESRIFHFSPGFVIIPWRVEFLLLMVDILHHLAYIKPCKQWDKLHINRCRISAINSIFYQSNYQLGSELQVEASVDNRFSSPESAWCLAMLPEKRRKTSTWRSLGGISKTWNHGGNQISRWHGIILGIMQDLFHQQYQLTWNLKITQLKRKIIWTKTWNLETISRFLVSLV